MVVVVGVVVGYWLQQCVVDCVVEYCVVVGSVVLYMYLVQLFVLGLLGQCMYVVEVEQYFILYVFCVQVGVCVFGVYM